MVFVDGDISGGRVGRAGPNVERTGSLLIKLA